MPLNMQNVGESETVVFLVPRLRMSAAGIIVSITSRLIVAISLA
jgi:hypothetical protein